MRVSRMLLLGTVVLFAACVDGTGPTHGSGRGSGVDGVVQLKELRGVVEMVDESRYGLRQSDDRVVALLYSDTDALASALGREVTLRGRFMESGEFAVAVLIIDGGAELARVRP